MSGTKMIIKCLFAFSLVAISKQENCIKSKSVLQTQLDAASAGDEICIANGVYSEWTINIYKSGITLKGQEGGKVILQGQSQVKILGKNIIVKNLVFTAPSGQRSFASPVEFGYRSSGCVVHDCMIHDHPAHVWVYVRGNSHTIHHCTFKNKPAPIIGTESQIITANDGKMFKLCFHHNKFMNYDPNAKINNHKHDGAEAIYIKLYRGAGRETKNINCEVHDNYFYKIDAEQETIGIKSSGNKVFMNAIEECYGGISLRHGRRNIVRKNFIKSRPEQHRDNFGINVHDAGHIVEDNWVIDVGEKHGIKLSGSNGPDDCNACHVRANNVTLNTNVLINSALHIGRRFDTGEYSPPKNINIYNMKSSCERHFPMITGTAVNSQNSFQGNPTTFFGKSYFSGPILALPEVITNLNPVLEAKKIIWKKQANDLGNYGVEQMKKIKCDAGVSWNKTADCDV